MDTPLDLPPSCESSPGPAIALYPGTFDPITNGHIDIIRRGLCLFDRIVVTVAVNDQKTPLFSLAERCALISECFPDLDGRIEVGATAGLIVEYARQHGARAIIRGRRALRTSRADGPATRA